MCDIQVFHGFANFYQYFIHDFSKIAGPLTSMLKNSNLTISSTISQSIDMANENEVHDGESKDNETNLSNLSVSKRSIKADYLISKGAKRGGGNTKKCVKAAKGPDYLNLATKKAFNHLWHTFTQAPIL